MIIGILVIALAIFLILARRRFGLFILALLSGITLNYYLNAETTEFLITSSLNVSSETISGFVGIILTLAPAFFVFGKGGKQENFVHNIINSFLVSAFTIALILPNLAKVFALDIFSKDIFIFSNEWMKYLILGGIIFAILDILTSKNKKLIRNNL